MRAENLSAVDVLDNDVFERNVLERAVVGDHHRHCPGINPVVLTVFQHNVVVEPDIPECNAPRLGAYEHIAPCRPRKRSCGSRSCRPRNREARQPSRSPVGIGAVGIRMGSDVFGRGIESLDGHVIVVVTLEGVFDQHIAAADEIHAVGVHDPADLLDIVDMHARAPGDLERPVRRVAQQDALDLQIVAIAELHLRPPAGTVILLRRTENAILEL